MKDRREEKTQRGIEQYKAFYAPFSPEEKEALISYYIARGAKRDVAEFCISEMFSDTSIGIGHASMIAVGIKCRVCGQPADSHAYCRPYCHLHNERAVNGKIGKVHGGYIAN